MSESAIRAAEAAAAPEARAARGGSTLHLVSGRTMRRALLDARASLGAKALVVDQKTDVDPATGAARVTLAVSTRIPRSTDALRVLREEAQVLLRDESPSTPPAPSRPVQRTPLADVERRLREHGASKKLRERILEGVVAREEREGSGHPLDLAASEAGKAFEIASLPLEKGRTTVLAFLGATGVGKTTSLAKLSARLAHAGRRVAIATLDGGRVGALEQIRAFGESIGVPAAALDDPGAFGRVLSVHGPARYDVVLVDGSGDLAGDIAALEELRENLDPARAGLEVLTVLPAGAAPAALASVTSAVETLAPIGAIVTKIDETEEPLPAMEHADGRDLAIAFLSNGPDIGRHFHRASAERFADVALIGRIG